MASGNVTYDNISFSVTSQDASPHGMSFNSDGTKMFFTGTASDEVHQYSLTNGFSMASGNVTYDNISFDHSGQETLAYGVEFNTDGTKMFVIGNGRSVYQYSF